MFSDGFFDYVTEINSKGEKGIISGRHFGNYVIVMSDLNDAETKIKSRRWEAYQQEFFNIQLNYVRSHNGNVAKIWNKYVEGITSEIENNYNKLIESFVISRGINNVEPFINDIKGILVMYGILKIFGMLDNDDLPDSLILSYEMLKLGYIPCGCAGKIPVGGSLYVY